jgi:general secretion pathway protein A
MKIAKPLDLRSRFGFNATPFTREIRVEDRFALPFFDEALTGLERSIDQRQSAALIAPAGTGKSFVLRALVKRLPEARYRVSYLKVTDLSRRDMCREIASAVGAEPAGSYPMLVRRLQERFVETADTGGQRPVILIDDAHAFRTDVLGLVRVLTNFEMDSRLVVSIVLAGQPPLRALLDREDLEDVARRLAHCATLRPLSREEIAAYVAHRATVAGARTAPFDQGALESLYEVGRGNLRATDCVALKALEVAADAGRDVVDAGTILEARKRVMP